MLNNYRWYRKLRGGIWCKNKHIRCKEDYYIVFYKWERLHIDKKKYLQYIPEYTLKEIYE